MTSPIHARLALGALQLVLGSGPLAGQTRDTMALRPALRLIDQYAEREMRRQGTPGLALAITDRNGVLAARSYGWADLDRRIPVTPATRFQIGSISKSFTVIALMQLADSGRFDPARPIARYLPWFTPPVRARAITGHDLLTHTAGLPSDGDDVPDSPAQGYVAARRLTPGPPGVRWAYSNIGYQVLTEALERIEHRGCPEIIRDRILTPLGMTASQASFTNADRPGMAVGYLPLHDDQPMRAGDPLVVAPWIEYAVGDGAIVSNVHDLSAYLRMLLNGGAGPDGPVLSPRGYQRMMGHHAKTSRGSATDYGYGMFLDTLAGRPVFWHSGGMLGYTSYLIGDTTAGLGVVAFINGPGDAAHEARFALGAVAAALAGDTLPALPPADDPSHFSDAAGFAGTFIAPDGRALRFVAGGDTLLLERGGVRQAVEAFDTDAVLGPLPEFPLYPIRFGRDTSGRVVEAWYGGDWYAGENYRGPRRFAAPAGWAAYTGHYRIMQPWEPSFRVVLRKGRLWWVAPDGGEEPLTPIGPREFRVGGPGAVERLRFDDVVDGHALRATLSGMAYYRFFTP